MICRILSFALLTIGWLMPNWSSAQGKVNIRITDGTPKADLVCYDVQLSYLGTDVALGSQNYRVFYSSQSLSFKKDESQLHLPNDEYIFNVVQHNEGIDASGIGPISFERDLGFINATIIFNDSRSKGQRLNEENLWTSIVALCFEEKENNTPHELILARKELTSEYGRAYIELSYVDQDGAIFSLPIENYTDFKK